MQWDRGLFLGCKTTEDEPPHFSGPTHSNIAILYFTNNFQSGNIRYLSVHKFPSLYTNNVILPPARGFFYPEDGGNTFLRNVDLRTIYTTTEIVKY
jgi:hypothetical protein